MNRNALIGGAALLLLAGIGAGYWFGSRTADPPAQVQAAGSERRILYYRNPMGLPDTSPVPKKDPMGMDYVPVYEGGDQDSDLPAGTVRISPAKVQLLGVRTEPAQLRSLNRTVRAVGTVQPNERLLYQVAPRFEGWIEKLHVNTTGQRVSRGQVLMDVYSPDLVTAQEEYLIALRGAAALGPSGAESPTVMQGLADGVLRRLRNWEISDEDLRTLRQRGIPDRLLAYRAAKGGVVLSKAGVEGMRFMPGEILFEIADLSSVWVLADVSEQDVGLIRLGQTVNLAIVAYPGRKFAGKVVFIYPTIDSGTRTAKVRVELANPDGLLKPAMFANVELLTEHAHGQVLSVPDSAVLDSGTRQLVIVQRDEGLFEPREVSLGMRADGFVEVTSGLEAQEQIVVRANFLIDAESNLRAALETFGGHTGHGDGAAPAAPDPATPAGHEGH